MTQGKPAVFDTPAIGAALGRSVYGRSPVINLNRLLSCVSVRTTSGVMTTYAHIDAIRFADTLQTLCRQVADRQTPAKQGR
jgi:hypothetical protein